MILSIFPGHTSAEIHVEHQTSGSFNRVFVVTLSSPQPTQPASSSLPFKRLRKMLCGNERKPKSEKLRHYILRIPRNSEPILLHQATTLIYLKEKFPYPTP
jgi:hypothetical protein